MFPLPSKVVLARASMSRVNPFGRKTVPWIVKAYVPLMVKLLQALAWAVKVDDAAKARVNRKSEMRDFIVPPIIFKICGLKPQESAQVACCGPVPSPGHS